MIRGFIIAVAAILLLGSHADAVLNGSGTEMDPYLIQSRADFDEFTSNYLYWDFEAYTKLMCDIDLAGTTYTQAVRASIWGKFDGNGHILANLTIDAPTQQNVGLFGCIEYYGEVKNLGLQNVNIIGFGYVGGLAGKNEGIIRNCYVTGVVSGMNDQTYVGGLVGLNDRAIDSCCVFDSIVTGHYAGGLVGYNDSYAPVKYAYAAALVNKLSESSVVGGLIGYNLSSYSSTACFWDSQISGLSDGVGSGESTGIIGKTTEEMKTFSTFAEAGWAISDFDSFDADWIIFAEGQDYPQIIYFAYRGPSDIVPLSGEGTPQNPYQISSAADLISLSQYGSVWNKHFLLTDNVDMSGFTMRPIGNPAVRFSGHFDGQNYEIRNISMDLPDKDYVGVFAFLDNYAEIINLRIENADITGKRYVGGLAGYNLGAITNCRTSGRISGNPAACVGGLAGLSFWGSISDCSSDADIIGTGATLGGLVGYHSSGTISGCSASGTITDTDPNTFGSLGGGLVGSNFQGVIENCSATGDISVTSASEYVCVGGLAGTNSDSSTILNSCAKGDVYTNSTSAISIICGGGFIGYKTDSDVNNCYALGSVLYDCPAEPNGFFGGLVGLSVEDSASHCYSTGIVGPNEVGGAVFCAGGLSGFNMDGAIYDSFWDMESSDQLTSDGGTGKTTAEMVTLSTFTDGGWDFENTWRICDAMNYPRLQWEPKPIGDFVCPEGVEAADLMILSEEWLAETMSADMAPDGGDGMVDLLDWTQFANAWLSQAGQINWDEACDLEPISVAPIIDEYDLMVFSEQWLSRSAHFADIAPEGAPDGRVDLWDYVLFAENWMLGVD